MYVLDMFNDKDRDFLNGGESPSALAQDVARAVKQEMQQGVAEGSQLNELAGYASDNKYKHLGSHKRYDVYVSKQKFNNLFFIAIAENPRTLEAKFKTKGNNPEEAVNNLKLEIDKEIDVATKVSGHAILDFNVDFVKDILELSTDVFYAKIVAGPKLVIAGRDMMEYPEIMRDDGFKSSTIRTYKGGEGTTKLPGVPLSAKSAAASSLIANGRYVLGDETSDKNGNRVFDLKFDSVVHASNEKIRLRAPALTVGTNRSQGVTEAPTSAAVRLGRAVQRVQGKTAASQARAVIPSSIPKPVAKPPVPVREGSMKDFHIDQQDEQWDGVVGYVINGLKKGMDIGRMELNLYKWAGKELFDVDQALADRGFENIAELANHIQEHGGRYVPPTFNLGGEQGGIMEGDDRQVVFSGTGANGGKYKIIQTGPTDFMIHANGKHIDTYSSLQRAMGVLKNEVPGLQQGVAEGSRNAYLKHNNLVDIEKPLAGLKSEFEKFLQTHDPKEKQKYQQGIKQRIKSEPMSGPKGVLPEQDVAEGVANMNSDELLNTVRGAIRKAIKETGDQSLSKIFVCLRSAIPASEALKNITSPISLEAVDNALQEVGIDFDDLLNFINKQAEKYGKQGVAEGDSGAKYKIRSIGRDSKGDYYISPSTGKKVYKSGVKRGDHENPKTGEHKGVAEGSLNESDKFTSWYDWKDQAKSSGYTITRKDDKIVALNKQGQVVGHWSDVGKFLSGKAPRPNFKRPVEQGVAEGAMPASVIRVKEKIRLMTDAEKKEYFKGKTQAQLQQMARRHGYGENSNVYAKYATQDVTEVSDAVKVSYKEKATQQVKDLTPHAKKGEYKDIAQNMISRRQKVIDRVTSRGVAEATGDKRFDSTLANIINGATPNTPEKFIKGIKTVAKTKYKFQVGDWVTIDPNETAKWPTSGMIGRISRISPDGTAVVNVNPGGGASGGGASGTHTSVPTSMLEKLAVNLDDQGMAEGSLNEFQDTSGKYGGDEEKSNYDIFIDHLYDIMVENGFMKELIADVFHNNDKRVQVDVEEQSGNSDMADIIIQQLVWAPATRWQQGIVRNGVISVLAPGKSSSFTVDLSSDWEISKAIKQVISTVKEAMTQGVAEGSGEPSWYKNRLTKPVWSYRTPRGSKIVVYKKPGGYGASMIKPNGEEQSINYVDIGGRALGSTFGSVENAVYQIYNSLKRTPSNMRVDVPDDFVAKGYVQQGVVEATGDQKFDSMMGQITGGAAPRQSVDSLNKSLTARTGSNPEAALAKWGQEFIKLLEKICRNFARQGVDRFSKLEKVGNVNDGGETMAHWLIEVAKQSNTSGITQADIQEFSSEFNTHGMWAWHQFPIAWGLNEWQDYKDQWTGPDGYIANLGQGVAEASDRMQVYGQKIIKQANAARAAEQAARAAEQAARAAEQAARAAELEPKKEEPPASSDYDSMSTRDFLKQLRDQRRPKKKGVAEEASPMIKPPTNRFDSKQEAFAYAKEHGGEVYKRTYIDPNTGNAQVSFTVKKVTLQSYSKAAGQEVRGAEGAREQAYRASMKSTVDEGSSEGKPRIRKFTILRPDGSKAARYEVLDYMGRRIGNVFDDPKFAKQYFYRNYDKLMNLDEDTTGSNPTDSVTMDVPLLIRIMEFAREDAQTDMDLHHVAEKLIALSANGTTLDMDAYARLVPTTTSKGPGADEPSVHEGTGRVWSSKDKQWKDQ